MVRKVRDLSTGQTAISFDIMASIFLGKASELHE